MNTIRIESELTVGKTKGFSGNIGKLQISSCKLTGLIGSKVECTVIITPKVSEYRDRVESGEMGACGNPQGSE